MLAPEQPSAKPIALRCLSRLLKNPSSFVLTRHRRLTISAAFTNVPRLIRRGVNFRGSTYGTSTFAWLFVAASLEGPFEQPVSLSRRLSDIQGRS